ncbi:MAG: arginine--tRNA ligase [Candidatus Vogelbacteria bacterium]
MLQEITKWLEETVKKLDYPIDLVAGRWGVKHPDELARGDYATNIALVLGKELKQKPMELAEQIVDVLNIKVAPLGSLKVRPWLDRVEVASPGFINFFLTRDFFTDEFKKILEQGDKYGKEITEIGKKVMIEYTDPNPFKEFHIGHLMSNTIGEAISRLIESQGAEVKRACYQGDVGLHVAKAIWGSLKLKEKNLKEIKKWGEVYVLGSQAYDSDETAKQEINEINKKVYNRSDTEINKIYDTGRQVSLDYFETIYQRLDTKFDYYFFESEMAKAGVEIVARFLEKGVFEKSDGAIIFKAEKYNSHLHTRVYLTSQGLPTYETKELSLHFAKAKVYPADLSVIITANEQDKVFEVGLEALRQIDSALAFKIKHLSHGLLRLPTGKMGSRTGAVITAESLLTEIKTVVSEKIAERVFSPEETEKIAEAVAVGAIKYSILKQSPGRDIIFDLAKSLSFEGDSGPYLQYSYVRARAVIEKAIAENILPNLVQASASSAGRPPEISELEKQLTRFPEIVVRSATLYAPNLLVTYLTELASSFNAYYATQKIVDSTDPQSPYRLALTTAFSHIMKSGLTFLAIPVLERM